MGLENQKVDGTMIRVMQTEKRMARIGSISATGFDIALATPTTSC